MVEREEQEVMEDLITFDAKRLKTMEVCTVNATEHTKLYFAAPSLQETDWRAFLASQTGYQPTFTYPFFGQEELFKGVLKARLQICFHPATFFAFISLEVDEESTEMKDEILGQLTEHMPSGSSFVLDVLRYICLKMGGRRVGKNSSDILRTQILTSIRSVTLLADLLNLTGIILQF